MSDRDDFERATNDLSLLEWVGVFVISPIWVPTILIAWVWTKLETLLRKP